MGHEIAENSRKPPEMGGLDVKKCSLVDIW